LLFNTIYLLSLLSYSINLNKKLTKRYLLIKNKKMKKTISILTSLIIVILMSITVNAQVLINEQFDYPIGDSLSLHGWTGHSGAGPINVAILSVGIINV